MHRGQGRQPWALRFDDRLGVKLLAGELSSLLYEGDWVAEWVKRVEHRFSPRHRLCRRHLGSACGKAALTGSAEIRDGEVEVLKRVRLPPIAVSNGIPVFFG